VLALVAAVASGAAAYVAVLLVIRPGLQPEIIRQVRSTVSGGERRGDP
jgi:hypothetical protein